MFLFEGLECPVRIVKVDDCRAIFLVNCKDWGCPSLDELGKVLNGTG
jgi:hypothetical protein